MASKQVYRLTDMSMHYIVMHVDIYIYFNAHAHAHTHVMMFYIMDALDSIQYGCK